MSNEPLYRTSVGNLRHSCKGDRSAVPPSPGPVNSQLESEGSAVSSIMVDALKSSSITQVNCVGEHTNIPNMTSSIALLQSAAKLWMVCLRLDNHPSKLTRVES